MRHIDRNDMSEDDIKWIFANHSNEVAKAVYGIEPKDVGWNPLDMSGVPPTPVASALDEHGRRYSITASGELEQKALPAGPARKSVTPPDNTDYDNWRKAELQEELKRRGLTTTGKNDELILRLMENDEENDDVAPYEEWTREDLETECAERGMSSDGTNEELIQRLHKYDNELASSGDAG